MSRNFSFTANIWLLWNALKIQHSTNVATVARRDRNGYHIREARERSEKGGKFYAPETSRLLQNGALSYNYGMQDLALTVYDSAHGTSQSATYLYCSLSLICACVVNLYTRRLLSTLFTSRKI